MTLEIDNVCKTIRRNEVLRSVSLEMESGNVYGIVGRNGSGKTMLFRAAAGLIRIDSGEIRCDGKALHRDMDTLPGLGMVLENAGLYPELTGIENLRRLAKVKNIIGEPEIRDAITRVGLDPDDRRTYRKYSLGMKQRIVLAQAIMEKPDVILLDEPTNSLDDEGVEQIRMMIAQEKERGALILLASHNREDIRLLADFVYHMEAGRLGPDRAGKEDDDEN